MASSASMSRSGHADCTRTRMSSRGRPFREASRTRSSGPRSLSGTRCRRPSSEVELRTELCATAPTSTAGADLVHNCALGFVCDLIDDAVDDFTDDQVHDVDDVYTSCPSPLASMTPMKLKLPLNDAQLVLSSGEPSILEEVDEDEDICAAALCFTARIAEEALCAVGPASPSWSLEVNTMSQTNACFDGVAKQLDLSAAADEDDCSSCDGYEEVYSLTSESPDEEAADDELETMAYVQMAVSLAKAAVAKGCDQFKDEVPTAEETMFERMWYYSEQASPMTEKVQTPYVPRLQNQFVTGWSRVDIQQPQQDANVDIAEAKAAARHALCAALLGRPSSFDESEEAETAENVEFLGEESSCNADLSFDFACGILDGALGQAADTWAKQEDGEDESEDEEDDKELEELRLQTMATLSKAAHTGELEAVFKQVSQEKELESLKAKARETLLKAATQRQLASQTDELTMLREKTKETLLKAAQTGQLVSALKASSEAAEMNALKMKVRNTLFQAAREGRLSPTLNEVAPKTPDLETAKEKVRSALAQGLQNGQLGKIFKDLKEDKTEEMQLKLRSTFAQGVLSGKLSSAVAEILAARQETSSVDASPAPVAAPAPATPTRTRRRVIGGVVRAPAIDLDLDVPLASPTSASWSDSGTTRKRHSKSGRKSLKEAIKPSFLDLGEDGEEAHLCSNAPKLMLQHPNLEAFNFRAAPTFDQHTSSKASARLRAASSSAMSMDLGSSSASHTMAPSSSPFRQVFTPSAFTLEPKMRASCSLGALPSHKVSKGGLLPIISSGKMSADSIAWSMQMSKTASKWSNTGLRGSASMVF